LRFVRRKLDMFQSLLTCLPSNGASRCAHEEWLMSDQWSTGPPHQHKTNKYMGLGKWVTLLKRC
jgi:hypothetical protein